MEKMKIRLYSIPNCKFCVEMKDGLIKMGLDFKEIDVSLPDNEKEFEEVIGISKTESVPTLIVGRYLLAPELNFWTITEGLKMVTEILNIKES